MKRRFKKYTFERWRNRMEIHERKKTYRVATFRGVEVMSNKEIFKIILRSLHDFSYSKEEYRCY